jgi:hypothetical protein
MSRAFTTDKWEIKLTEEREGFYEYEEDLEIYDRRRRYLLCIVFLLPFLCDSLRQAVDWRLCNKSCPRGDAEVGIAGLDRFFTAEER